MKKALYVGLFMVLGLLLATVLHAAIEWPILWLVTNNYEVYGQSFVWRHWAVLHGYGGTMLWILGALLGVAGGFRYWRILYIEKRYGTPRW